MTLTLSNGTVVGLPHLGKNRGLDGLREKTVTMQTRYALRNKYGSDRVIVSCGAEFSGVSWTGRCWLDGESLKCVISKSPRPVIID